MRKWLRIGPVLLVKICNIKYLPEVQRISFRHLIVLLIFLFKPDFGYCQKATIREEYITFPTYPFSDPDPVAKPGRIYPYYRFDGYASAPMERKWKMVILENKWIKLWISPEMGGKIYGALDKLTGKYFVYFNKVIKFRNVALRGPWTSGGIEFNFGTIGHAPTTAAPVDYFCRSDSDGSVSCYLGSLDLTSRTEWRVQVRLPSDKAWFETNSTWRNPTTFNTSLYHWMNSSIETDNDLRYLFPGVAYIDHEGNSFSWPFAGDSTDISLYSNNDYGNNHSYHVLGSYTDWFAGYYSNSDFGSGHLSGYPFKPGKKIWIWALSRQGEIWKDLLTDGDSKQYTEIQTGLLFNQAADGSSATPFKNQFFEPGAVESFSEKWFPFSGTKGAKAISSEGVLNFYKSGNGTRVVFQALSAIRDTLVVTDSAGKILSTFALKMEPRQLFDKQVEFPCENLFIKLKNGELSVRPDDQNEKTLNRPFKTFDDFDWNSSFGLYTKGIEKARQRNYSEARIYLNRCLETDKFFIPAYNSLAELDIRQLKYAEAREKLLHVLEFDTYDPDANFLYGTILEKSGEYLRAKDAYGITLTSQKYRLASLNRLAIVALKEKKYNEAWQYLSSAGLYEGMDKNICETAVVTARLRKDQKSHRLLVQWLEDSDPLNHLARFEKYYNLKDSTLLNEFKSRINNEFPCETYLELALWYCNAGLYPEAKTILDLSPSNPEINLYLAYLEYLITGSSSMSDVYLSKTINSDIFLVFPFRDETVDVLKWALSRNDSWKLDYYLAIIYWNKGLTDLADQYFGKCKDEPRDYEFYITRGNFYSEVKPSLTENDYLMALEKGKQEWRPVHCLVQYYISKNAYKKALQISSDAYKKFSSSYIIGSDYAVSLLYNNEYEKCIKLLKDLTILPYEGASYGREVWRNANILNSLKYLLNNNLSKALIYIENAYKWPENLGVGRPYDVDERLEDYIKAGILEKLKRSDEAAVLYKKILDYHKDQPESNGSITGIKVLTLQKTGYKNEAKIVLQKWSAVRNSDLAFKWISLVFRNQLIEANELIEKSWSPSDGMPWNPVPADNDFRIIYETIRTIFY